MPDKKAKEVKVSVSFTPVKLLTYGATAAAIAGLVWAICAAIDSKEAHQAAGFFGGFFFAIFGGLVLYGLANMLSRKS